MPATDAQETCTRNLHVCRSIWYKFFWYKFLTHNWAQLSYFSTETVRHVTRTVQRDWPESCFGARNCGKVATNFSCEFLVPVSGTSFLSVCRWHVCSVRWVSETRYVTLRTADVVIDVERGSADTQGGSAWSSDRRAWITVTQWVGVRTATKQTRRPQLTSSLYSQSIDQSINTINQLIN